VGGNGPKERNLDVLLSGGDTAGLFLGVFGFFIFPPFEEEALIAHVRTAKDQGFDTGSPKDFGGSVTSLLRT